MTAPTRGSEAGGDIADPRLAGDGVRHIEWAADGGCGAGGPKPGVVLFGRRAGICAAYHDGSVKWLECRGFSTSRVKVLRILSGQPGEGLEVEQ